MEKFWVKYNFNQLENDVSNPQCYAHTQLEFFNDFYTKEGAMSYVKGLYEEKTSMLKCKVKNGMKLDKVKIIASYCDENGCGIRASYENIDIHKSVEFNISAIIIAEAEK